MRDSELKLSVRQLGKRNVAQHNVWASAEKPWEAFNPQDSEPCSISSQDITQGIQDCDPPGIHRGLTDGCLKTPI